MSDMERFFTRETANAGVKEPLYLPDGTPTEHWLLILGQDSDEFRQAEAQARRRVLELAQIEDETERQQAIRDQEMDMRVALIGGWSFSEDCIPENIRRFLAESPTNADMVDRIAANRQRFFGKGLSNSLATPSPSSDSTKSQKAPSKR